MTDDIGHGTRVAGIIAAASGNAEGICGVAFGANVLPLDVATTAGQASIADVIDAVEYAVDHRASVINISLRTFADSTALRETLEQAADSAVIVAAAGNDAQGDAPVYPAAYERVIGVAAADTANNRAPFSNYNTSGVRNVDLAAPGVRIFSCIPGGLYDGAQGSGTSFAVPMVSGAAALMISRYLSRDFGRSGPHFSAGFRK